MRYIVHIDETNIYTAEIEAESGEDAIEKAYAIADDVICRSEICYSETNIQYVEELEGEIA